MIKPSTSLPPITYGVNPRDYHAIGASLDRGDRRKIMSNSELKKFASCPSRWLRGHKEKETDSMEWGSLLDCVLLTPDRFGDTYAICPETYLADGKKKGEPQEEKAWNWNSTVCKQWRAEHEEKGLIVVKPDVCSEAHLAKSRIMSDPLLSHVITASDAQVQVCADYHDRATGFVIPIKCLIDIVPHRKSTLFNSMLADLKTACTGAPYPWAKAVHANGYHMQAALYLDAYNAVSGERRNVFCHVVQENFPPYETARRMLSEEYLQLGRDTYNSALANYCQCLKNNEWPGLDDADGMGEIYDGWRLVHPEAYMVRQD